MSAAPQLRLRPGALQRICHELGVTRPELARRIGVSPQTLRRVDTGASMPSTRVIAGLTILTGEPVETFLSGL